MKVIIFPQDDNRVSVVIPAPEFADQVDAVANKDVPEGKPWRIVDTDDLPSRDTRDCWRWTDAGLLDIAPEVIP